jgi:hypothetical protein
MAKYVFEGGIDFYNELYNSLDDDSNVNENPVETCLITGEPLDQFHFTMDCNHKFNYAPLYKDLLNFKNKLSYMEIAKFKNNEIRCPYCRKKQTNLLPYHEELGLAKVNGINDWKLEKEKEKVETVKPQKKPMWVTGTCCVYKCTSTLVAKNPKDDKIYCYKHNREWIKLNAVQKTLDVTGFTCGLCTQLFKSGPRKGQVCGATAYTNTNGCCKRHYKPFSSNIIVSPINMNENVIIA